MRKSIVSILLILMSINICVTANDFQPDSLISEVDYDYDITAGETDGETWITCFGTLSMSIEIPETAESIMFCRANGPTVKFHYPPFYNTIRPLDISGKSKIEISYDNVEYYSYFRVQFTIDGTTYYSSHYAVSDLMDPEDLQILKGTASTIEINANSPEIKILNEGVTVNCKSSCLIEIASIDGKSILLETTDKDTTIPLPSGIYIIRLHFNNKCESRKIFIR